MENSRAQSSTLVTSLTYPCFVANFFFDSGVALVLDMLTLALALDLALAFNLVEVLAYSLQFSRFLSGFHFFSTCIMRSG